ncbi:MAG: hypothetical protein ACP5QN_03255, partial [Minisyncoccia bacterium]
MKFKLGLLVFILIFVNIFLFKYLVLAQNFPSGCKDIDENGKINEVDCGAPENEKCSICFGGADNESGCKDIDENGRINEVDCGAPENEKC